ncbi:MAG: glycosidase [Thermoprotei archaeon]|nr:MAG: glycosidase [Thermoprotei archaeon]RLF03338.1 MAG: glycosidase [Thermoprotei archaeon]
MVILSLRRYSREIEESLDRRQREFLSSEKGLRKPITEDIFEKRILISPEDLRVVNYRRSRPSAAFNPAALLRDNILYIYPRLIFDYYKYTSSIALFRVNVEELLNEVFEKPLETRIILWPRELWEFLGTEDPRATPVDGRIYMLYTGKGYHLEEGDELKYRDVLGFVELSPLNEVLRKGFFKIVQEGDVYLSDSQKDSAFLKIDSSKATMLTRLMVRNIKICWRACASIRDLEIYGDTLEPVLGLEDWEFKTGWSTNAIELSSNEYLVGWHAVVKSDLSYRNGFAIVNDQGELLAVSNYLLAPKGLEEEYGDRALVIFGDGLVKYGELLIWIGGISDYAIGVFVTELDRVLEKLKWVSR